VGEVRRSSFAAAIVLRPTLRNALLVAAAGIPCRVGTAFRAYSWFFTHRVRQHRRGSGRHELELNLGLLDPFRGFDRAGGDESEVPLPWVPVGPEARRAARALVGDGKPYVVLHPGSGGSASEWPPEHFARLGSALKARHELQVVVTGVAAESALVARVAAAVPGALPLAGRTSLPVLAALLAGARAVVAASTGTLHLAAAVGTPVVGVYPALPDISPVRWGPRGQTAVALAAPMTVPHGLGAGEAGGTSMAAVTPEAVLAELTPWLGEEKSGAV
jgi:ADP-heptose:LPS heptosyltransferase